jgi:uncharacterized protein with HEPN domain
MLERYQRIRRYIQAGRDQCLVTEETQDAVIRNIEIIGEAAKHVSSDTRTLLPGIDWKRVCGMRDVLIHDYIAVDLDQVWNVASFGIPELEAVLGRSLGLEADAGKT